MSVLYSALLFVHIVSALGLFMVEGLVFFTLRELRAAGHIEAARLALARVLLVEKGAKPMPVLALLSGLGLCALAWGFTRPWVLLSLVGFVGIAVLVNVVDAPRVKRVKTLLGQDLPLEQVRPALHDPVLRRGGRARLGLLLWLVFLMTVKPALLLGLAALLLALAAALLLPVRAAPAPTTASA